MLMNLVSQQHGYQLGDSSQDQVGMESFFVLSLPSGKPEAVFKVIDRAFHSGSDFVSSVLFDGATDRSRISSVITLLLNINHPTAFGGCTGRFTFTFPVRFFRLRVVYSFGFGAYEFVSGESGL